MSLFNRKKNYFASTKSSKTATLAKLGLFVAVVLGLLYLASLVSLHSGQTSGYVRNVQTNALLRTTDFSLVVIGMKADKGGTTNSEYYSIRAGNSDLVKQIKRYSIKEERVVIEYDEPLISLLQMTTYPRVVTAVKTEAEALRENGDDAVATPAAVPPVMQKQVAAPPAVSAQVVVAPAVNASDINVMVPASASK